MLLRLHINQFKAYEDETIELEPFSVLIGRNGSGKTSVLQALEFFHGLVADSLRDHLESRRWDYQDLPRLRAANFEFGFEALIELEDKLCWWELRLGKRLRAGIAAEHIYRIAPEHASDVKAGARPDASVDRLLLDRTGRSMRRFDFAAAQWESVTQTLTSSWLQSVDPNFDSTRFPDLLRIAEWARRIQRYVVLDPNRLREPARLSPDGIGTTGERLAGFLRHLRSKRPEAFQRVLDRVRAAYPNLIDVEIQSHNGSSYALAVRERWSEQGSPRLNARQTSDGLLRLFAFAALPEVEPRPTLIMVDEVENGVHPALLDSVVLLLESLAGEEGIQVVATSHSPLVLNSVSDASSVVIAERDKEGRAQTYRLDQTAGFERLSSVFDKGEMWLALGESGLISGPHEHV